MAFIEASAIRAHMEGGTPDRGPETKCSFCGCYLMPEAESNRRYSRVTFDGQMLPKKSDREFWIDITKHDNFDIDTKLHIDSHPDRFALYYFFKARSIPYIESAFVFLHKPCLERILASDVSSSHDWRG